MNRKRSILPFSLIPEAAEKELVDGFGYQACSKDQLLFEQGITPMDHLWILSKGSAAFFFDSGRGRILEGMLRPGDHFGAFSILFNQGVAIRNLISTEESVFATFPADRFKNTCDQYPEFAAHFEGSFGRCMRNPVFFDLMAEQVRGQKASLPFFNRPVRSVFKPNLFSCSEDTPVREAVAKMSQNNTSAILVKSGTGQYSGIVTDADLRKKVFSKDPDMQEPVSGIMSSPVASVSADSQVFEAFLSMVENDLRHMAVRGSTGHPAGIIRQKDLISAQTNSSFFLFKSIRNAADMSALKGVHARLEEMLFDPIRNGADPEYITRLITTFSDAIIRQIIRFTLEELGPAPCGFVFLTMGSEGRQEQTLVSDQDNAIVFEDTPDNDHSKAYFDKFALLVCDRLNEAGYRFCDGGNMAKNEKWCQPLATWKSYFDQWIRAAKPEHLLNAGIFFDFRGTWGDLTLAETLKTHLLQAVGRWPGFLRSMTENTLQFKAPLTRFGKFIVESKGPERGNLDIKLAMLPLIDFTRIYALKNGIGEPNTLTRLFRLYIRHAITKKEHTDLVRAYNFLMRRRFLNQITAIMDERRTPDNYINPGNLSSLDQIMLKEIFKMTAGLQDKLGIEFTGVV